MKEKKILELHIEKGSKSGTQIKFDGELCFPKMIVFGHYHEILILSQYLTYIYQLFHGLLLIFYFFLENTCFPKNFFLFELP